MLEISFCTVGGTVSGSTGVEFVVLDVPFRLLPTGVFDCVVTEASLFSVFVLKLESRGCLGINKVTTEPLRELGAV